jgi:hypothetical protein
MVISPHVFDHTKLKPFTSGELYHGEFETGLYPGGKNEIPDAHRRLGEQIAREVRPLDTSGKVDEQNGRIGAIVKGHSNCNDYFTALGKHFDANREELNPAFTLLNAAVGGQQLPYLSALQGKVWDRAKEVLTEKGCTAEQVQILFFHPTWHPAGNREGMQPGQFPHIMNVMQQQMQKVLAHCAKIYPNLKMAYLTCDGLRHYTGFEPHVWMEAFAFKWMIASQIKGEPTAACTGPNRQIPYIQWGPYIWDNTWDASYFTDGVHPGEKAKGIFVEKYWKFLKSNSPSRILFRL